MSADIQIFLPTWNIFSDAAGVRVRVGGDHGDVRGLGVRGGRGGLRGSELGHGDGGQLLERLVPVPAPLLPHRGAHARGIRGTHVDISTFYLYYLLHTGSLGCIVSSLDRCPGEPDLPSEHRPHPGVQAAG